MVMSPSALTLMMSASTGVSGDPEAEGSWSGSDGSRKADVSMKKMSRRNTTSISGAMSMAWLGRLGRRNIPAEKLRPGLRRWWTNLR